MNQPQQRHYPRYALRCPVKLWIYDEDYDDEEEAFIVLGFTNSVSLGGIFFTSRSLLLSESARVKIELELPEGKGTLRANGRVAHYYKLPATDADTYEPGMGIEFVELDERETARLATLLPAA